MTESTAERARPVRIHVIIRDKQRLCGYDAPGVDVTEEEVSQIPLCPACATAMEVLFGQLYGIDCLDPDLDIREGWQLLLSDTGWADIYGDQDYPEDNWGYALWEDVRELQRQHQTAISPCVLYRYYDANDVLLYVGITDNANARREQHEKGSVWAEFAARETSEQLPSRKDALAAERAIIEAEGPLFNRAHAAPDRDRRVIDYLIAHDALHLLTAP